MISDQDWIESSLCAAAESNPHADAALRETLAALLSNTISQKALFQE